MHKLSNPKPLELSEASHTTRLVSFEEGPRVAAEKLRRATPVTLATWVAFAFALYIVAFIVPHGVTAFILGFMLLFEFTEVIARGSFQELLISASWLANPALWLGVVFLLRRDLRSAKRAGFVALLFSLLAVFSGMWLAAYWVWIGSMVMFLVAAYKCSGVAVSARSRKPRPVDPDL
jgi:hypothetical protein